MSLAHTLEELRRYANRRIPTGGFLRAVLANDLFEAHARADEGNIEDMHEIVLHIYNYLPGDCWGSYAKVDEWLRGPHCEDGQ